MKPYRVFIRSGTSRSCSVFALLIAGLAWLGAWPMPRPVLSQAPESPPGGCAKFRISMFPVTERAWKALEPARADQPPRERPAGR